MMKTLPFVCLSLLLATVADAHEGHSHAPSEMKKEEIVRLNTEPAQQRLVVFQDTKEAPAPELAKLFTPFQETVKVRFDRHYLFVESNGMPAHPMMIGIKAWQQQVPLPQSYAGENAWRIPLHPVPATNPMSTKEHFFRGAIALAVNGVPIFNPIKNDGKTDTLEAGELDQWGGHCGRADDYHYHVAPVHLEKTVGAGNPVAVALDGYPIYGYNDPNSKPPTDLDWLNGHKGSDGKYHYHATQTFPYLNGGFYGEVVEQNGQVDPQPRARPMRPSLSGLKGAKITGFENPKPDSYVVIYDVNGDKRSVRYTVADDGSATFSFVSQQGTTTETYTPRQRGERGDAVRRNGAPSPEEKRPTRGEQPAGDRGGERRGGQGQPGQGGARRGDGPSQGGGGNPILKALDVNRDGIVDKAEIQKAATALLTLDKNRDGQLTSEELRGTGGQRGQDNLPQAGRRQGDRGQGDRPQRGGRQGNGRPNQAGGPRGPQPGDGPRQPWIIVHAAEIDLNKDNIISRDELVGESEKAFGGYDTDQNEELSDSELRVKGNVRSAMGGFLRGHAKELDHNNDGVLTRKEVVDNATKMFAKIDSNADGKITRTELEASQRTGSAQQSDSRVVDEVTSPKPEATDEANNEAADGATSPEAKGSVTSSTTDQPNFVFFLIDDMGWCDMGFSGNKFIETPNTDRIAREGIIFSQAYASAPNCAPSRACIMSGQYPPRHGIYTVVDERHAPGSAHHKITAAHSSDTMDTEVVTIAECLKDAGYATAAFGMWNLGRGQSGPSTATGQGFDSYKKPRDLGFDQRAYFDQDGEFITDVFTNHGIDFIENNKDRPFFLYLPYHAIHAPFEPKADLVAKYERKARAMRNRNADPIYAAMIDAVDHNVGRIMDTLKRLKLDDKTMVIFTSDNGGVPQFVAPLNGSKGALYEGGIRVPACVWWSGIRNAGRTCDTPILGMDFYPTMLDAANVSRPKQTLDGVSFLPVLQDTGEVKRDAVFWHFPSYVGRGKPSSAIRMGDWKLIEHYEDQSLELYNLAEDVGESRNLATVNQAKANELYTRLTSWQKETSAAIPSPSNPNYDPTASRNRRNRGQKGVRQNPRKNR
ncbi:MAG: sulfatase-like hydrolase/transferase [Planctomycetota bacterium]